MKIKIDENIPSSLVEDLTALGHDVLSVFQQGLKGASDSLVWDKVQHEERFFITQDLDFSDINKYRPGTHAGMLLVRLREPGRLKLRKTVKDLFVDPSLVESWVGAFIVVSDHKLRVQRPE